MRFRKYIVAIGILTVFNQSSFAAMESTNYSITSSVLSGGGAPISSESFQVNSTLGQSSPITPSDSTDFEAYPGFWYTLTQPFCPWDLDPRYPNGDGDVDGLDVDTFIQNFGPEDSEKYDLNDLNGFASEFGKTNCSD